MQMIRHSMHRWFDQIAGLSTFFYRLIFTVTQAFQDSRFVLHTSGKLRRFWLVHFRKGYVRRQLSVRQGDCHQCGTCCNLLSHLPHVDKTGALPGLRHLSAASLQGLPDRSAGY